MAKKEDEKKLKLEDYLAYGMTFGLLGGSLLSTFAFMFGNTEIGMGSIGTGLLVGMTIGLLLFTMQNGNDET
ncbi:MAG: hypothetical protein LRY73_09565 [Bacillus sp. (in: Bacteria)]|nr:hypothetical protein [Bacillus sp. (in: firmicutes)]